MNSWINIGRIEDIPRQGSRVVKTESSGDIAIFRTVSDSIYALNNKCPHKGGPISEGIVHGEQITCPLHNWTFDLATGEATGADKGATGHYPIKIEDGEIYLSLSVDYVQ
ncbi:MAG: nitrite reductase small subunit NirD [Magnetococcales bacterium]|nr:nitrite reductase small subunit NirD [Magnetococcales bacterium]